MNKKGKRAILVLLAVVIVLLIIGGYWIFIPVRGPLIVEGPMFQHQTPQEIKEPAKVEKAVVVKKPKPIRTVEVVHRPIQATYASPQRQGPFRWTDPGRDPFLGPFETREQLRDLYMPKEAVFAKALQEADSSLPAGNIAKYTGVCLAQGRGLTEYTVPSGTRVSWMIYDSGKVLHDVEVVGDRPGIVVSILREYKTGEKLVYDFHWSKACGNVIPLGTRVPLAKPAPALTAPPVPSAPPSVSAPTSQNQQVNVTQNVNVRVNVPQSPNYQQRPRPPRRICPPPQYQEQGYGQGGYGRGQMIHPQRPPWWQGQW